MPRFSKYFKLGRTQHELDFVDVSNDYDTPVYVDPYAIEIRDDAWSIHASEYLRTFFKQLLDALKDGDDQRATELMSHLREPRETYLGVSRGPPSGRGVGRMQAQQMIEAIRKSKAFKTNLLQDLSEMALYVDGIDRDKISDLSTNILRELLVTYTQSQCELYEIPVKEYNGPPIWNPKKGNWISKIVELPFIKKEPVLLVPKFAVRRTLSLDSQEFYNKQITDFLVAENLRASSSLVRTVKGKPHVFKKDAREKDPKDKNRIAELVSAHPELLEAYKKLAKDHKSLQQFNDEDPTITSVCAQLANVFAEIQAGHKDASRYHNLVLAALTALFYPDLVDPHKEWDIHEGRKRIDIVFTNASDSGFFAHRRDGANTNAQFVIVECKNYSDDIGNEEFDQLLGRFDRNRGFFGIITELAPVWRLPRPGDYAACLSSSPDSFLSTFRLASNVIGLT